MHVAEAAMIIARGTSTKIKPCQLSINEIQRIIRLPEAEGGLVGLPETSNHFWKALCVENLEIHVTPIQRTPSFYEGSILYIQCSCFFLC